VVETITETWSVEICGHLITTSRIIHVSPAAVAYFVNVPVDITVPWWWRTRHPDGRLYEWTDGTLYD